MRNATLTRIHAKAKPLSILAVLHTDVMVSDYPIQPAMAITFFRLFFWLRWEWIESQRMGGRA
jgi:hypothetical protein